MFNFKFVATCLMFSPYYHHLDMKYDQGLWGRSTIT